MHFRSFLCLTLATLAIATPSRMLRRRALLNDRPDGYASLNGGTTGGQGGNQTIIVSNYTELVAGVKDDIPRIVILNGTITQAGKVRVGSNKSIIGAGPNARLLGLGLLIINKKNVIVRNVNISKVLAADGDAITVQNSTNIWIDHCELSSDRDHDKDYYDGLLDVTHGSDFVTISNTYFHDHWKGSLVGHSDKNSGEDTGHLRVTYYGNHWHNINSRMPSFRFGTGHVYNTYFESCHDGINTRQSAQILVESNVFAAVSKPLFSTDSGYAVARENDFGSGGNNAPRGTVLRMPYNYSTIPSTEVKAAVIRKAGATLVYA